MKILKVETLESSFEQWLGTSNRFILALVRLLEPLTHINHW